MGKEGENTTLCAAVDEKDEYKYRELVDHQKRRAEQQICLLKDQSRHISN